MAKTMKQSGNDRHDGAHFARYTLIGFFTVAPLWVTWLVFDFLLGILAGAGTPATAGSCPRRSAILVDPGGLVA